MLLVKEKWHRRFWRRSSSLHSPENTLTCLVSIELPCTKRHYTTMISWCILIILQQRLGSSFVSPIPLASHFCVFDIYHVLVASLFALACRFLLYCVSQSWYAVRRSSLEGRRNRVCILQWRKRWKILPVTHNSKSRNHRHLNSGHPPKRWRH